ncbi:MAG: putative manganese transporter [Hyphomicrobiales bacterium]
MTELALRTGRRLFVQLDFALRRNLWRILLVLVLFTLIFASSGGLRDTVLNALADAYLAVTVFVAGTLGIVYGLEKLLRADVGKFLERQGILQAPMSAFLGALPGCGGAIVVVTQYTRGYVSFGSVVAVLVSTMGDAAFLLLARDPAVGAFIFVLGFSVGSLSGWVVDKIHGKEFMRSQISERTIVEHRKTHDLTADERVSTFTWSDMLWMIILIPGFFLGIFGAFLVDTDAFFGPLGAYEPTKWLGVAGALLCAVMWSLAGHQNTHDRHDSVELEHISTWRRIILDTNFITVWVIMGFLVYEVGVHALGADLESFFKVWAPLVPLMGILIGLLPGCGPQIVVTTLYLNGLIPLSAQIGNAISNDGDALFPAIALAPKAAMLATVYSAVPALIFAYSWYFIFE